VLIEAGVLIMLGFFGPRDRAWLSAIFAHLTFKRTVAPTTGRRG
jgi:hypothetical protein